MTFAAYGSEPQKTTSPTPATMKAARAKRTLGEDAAPAKGHSTNGVPADYRQVNGWGADLDPANRPSVPKELPSTVMTARGDVKHWQQPRTKVHRSNEHPDLTPVFGESCPPHGLSGLVRDYAYQFGEASNRHWLTLMFADRIDVFESFVADTIRGLYVKEKGWSAYAKYPNRDNGAGNGHRGRKALAGAAAMVGVVALGFYLASALRED